MPTYEYQCLSCRQHFERKQSFSEEPVKVCPGCGGEVRRVLHAPGLVFKGSGWYVTDSRKSTEPSEGASSSPAAADGASANGAAKAGEAKTGEAKAGEAKAGEAKSSGASGGSGGSGASGSDSGGGSSAGGKRDSAPPKSGGAKGS